MAWLGFVFDLDKKRLNNPYFRQISKSYLVGNVISLYIKKQSIAAHRNTQYG